MQFQVKIVNWDKYNPPPTKGRACWFRTNMDIFSDHVVGKMTGDQFKVWTWLCCERTRIERDWYTVDTDMIRRCIRVRTHSIHSCITLATEFGLVDTNGYLSPKGFKAKRSLNKPLQTDKQTDKQTDNEIRNQNLISEQEEAVEVGLKPKDLFEIWNANCGPLQKASRLTSSRSEKCRLRIGENTDRSFWETAVKNLASSTFAISGKWSNFDWLIANDTNAVKANEGKYGDAGAKPVTKYLSNREQLIIAGIITEDDPEWAVS